MTANVDDVPTQPLGEPASRHNPTTSILLEREAAARNRAGLVFVGVSTLLVAGLLQVWPRPGFTHYLTSGLLVAVSGSAFALYLRFRSGKTRPPPFPIVGVATTIAMLAFVSELGVLSPATAGLTGAVYYFGLDADPRRGNIVFATALLGYVGLAALTLTGVMPLSEALLPLPFDASPQIALVLTGVAAFLAATFWLARLSRRAAVSALDQLEQARREVGIGRALLAEAQADLDNVRHGGRLGRFSGRAIGAHAAGEVIGRGACGEVYDAQSAESGDPVAIKVLHAHVLDDDVQRERFFREIEVLRALRSTHIVKVLESGRCSDGSPYFVMERLRGRDLKDHLDDVGRLSTAEAIKLASEVGGALAAAQEAGVVHRDVKPRNLFFAEEGEEAVWKVLDFGVSTTGGGTLTQGAAVGTPDYMSPEQALGGQVDHRTDVFALGLVLYRGLTGRPAFASDSVAQSLYLVRHAQPLRPSSLATLPPDIDLVLALALAKDRERRLRSTVALAAALRDAARGELDENLRNGARALLDEHPWGEHEAATRS